MDAIGARYAWMDGEFVPWGEAKVHIASSCVTEGSSVFEGIRAYWSPSTKATVSVQDQGASRQTGPICKEEESQDVFSEPAGGAAAQRDRRLAL